MPPKDTARHTNHDTRRTSLNLDTSLVAEARDVLGTAGTTETIHRALEEVVVRERRRRAAALRFDNLSEVEWRQVRRWGAED